MTKGIEAVQRSTPAFIEELQRELIRTLDETREPEPVCDRLHRGVQRLQRGDIDPERLIMRKRVSQRLDAYNQRTQTVAALERAERQGVPRHPGQDVEYVVVDDSRCSPARVWLAHETLNEYDGEFYAELALRAGESILAPLGWDRDRIRQHLRGTLTRTLTSYR